MGGRAVGRGTGASRGAGATARARRPGCCRLPRGLERSTARSLRRRPAALRPSPSLLNATLSLTRRLGGSEVQLVCEVVPAAASNGTRELARWPPLVRSSISGTQLAPVPSFICAAGSGGKSSSRRLERLRVMLTPVAGGTSALRAAPRAARQAGRSARGVRVSASSGAWTPHMFGEGRTGRTIAGRQPLRASAFRAGLCGGGGRGGREPGRTSLVATSGFCFGGASASPLPGRRGLPARGGRPH